MIRREGHSAIVETSLTLKTAAQASELGVAAINDGATEFDLSKVDEVDSSGLAVLFSWIRAAAARSVAVRFLAIPDQLRSLADVYDVAEVLTGHLATDA